jgi:hypothetical protein
VGCGFWWKGTIAKCMTLTSNKLCRQDLDVLHLEIMRHLHVVQQEKG